ncbi:MAG: HigA family addiction module antidote protein [Gammaproteobacteria bacterium]|nr:HigA family addiction module antidote protein [Gammaproteobacteria bacterium]
MDNQNHYQPDYTVAPGEIIEEHREASGMTQAELAQRLGFSTKHVNRLLRGHEPVTPETALKLEAVFGLPARVWLALESRYREHLAREADEEALASEEHWLSEVPHRDLARLGWIPPRQKGAALVRSLRAFFGVGSLDYLPCVWRGTQAAYRKTEAFRSHEWAMLAWLAQGEREAERVRCQPFDAAALRAALPGIKALSRLPGTEFVEPLVERCARVGVALVFVAAPGGARVSGATRWLDKDRALVQLSLRYKTDDHLWFTLFHEFGHVLLHGKREEFIDFEKRIDQTVQEKEADEFAARQLVDPAAMTRFIVAGDFSPTAVQGFAAEQSVAPGIVVGQLQHRKVVPYRSVLSKLKKSFRWQHETAS